MPAVEAREMRAHGCLTRRRAINVGDVTHRSEALLVEEGLRIQAQTVTALSPNQTANLWTYSY